jgi:phosphoribosyl-ATP pyrophosphohydrolase/phosphoribosyl-AMP cyclohydrolase
MSFNAADIDKLDFAKGDGLLPAIVQDASTGAVLMLAYMNREALQQTLLRGHVVFFSRSRQALWEKGETSGHSLKLVRIQADCDADTLLVSAEPVGPACHRNTPTCFGDGGASELPAVHFLGELERVIAQRLTERPEDSYTARLHARGTRRMAQKVGEEGVEVALAATAGDDAELVSESADLIFHLALVLAARGLSLQDVARELQARHKQRTAAKA